MNNTIDFDFYPQLFPSPMRRSRLSELLQAMAEYYNLHNNDPKVFKKRHLPCLKVVLLQFGC